MMNPPYAYWILGCVSLFVFWVNSILIVADGAKHWSRARAYRQRLLSATVSPSEVTATLRIDCIAHARTDVTTEEIVCRERSLDAQPHAVLASRTKDRFDIDATDEGVAPGWNDLYRQASASRGASIKRTLTVTTNPVRADGAQRAWIVLPGARREILQRPQQILWSLIGTVAGTVLCSTLCFVPPLFGAVSQLGALACLAFFLGVQPLTGTLRRWATDHESVDEQAFSLRRENVDVSASSI